MKFFTSSLIAALAGLASAEQMVDFAKETKTYKSHFGNIVEEQSWEGLTKKNITFPSEHITRDPAQQTDLITNMTKIIQDKKARQANGLGNIDPDYTCASRNPDGSVSEPFEFLPVYAGEITPADPYEVY